MRAQTVVIRGFTVARFHLEVEYGLDGHRFITRVSYHDVDLFELQARYGADALNRVFAHIALFEALKFCSPFPETLEITSLVEWLTPASIATFAATYRLAYTQHMFENQVSDYDGPEVVFEGTPGDWRPIVVQQQREILLAGNGGGKDSLLVSSLLESAALPYASFQWARSEYGRFKDQHHLIDRLYDHLSPERVHRISVHDDFTDGTFMRLYHPDLSGSFTLGTPECIFQALPIMLDQGYTHLVFGNEKSADRGNLHWEALGREVNHQWIKSLEAELLFGAFVRDHLVDGFAYYSLLKPIHDARIFERLRAFEEAIPATHSCNEWKPWCGKCSKCAYVWLNYMAHFDGDMVNGIFGANLFDDPDLETYWLQLMGLEEHNAFECVGHTEETRLAMRACLDRGLTGRALDIFEQRVLADASIDWERLSAQYLEVDQVNHNIPEAVFAKVHDHL